MTWSINDEFRPLRSGDLQPGTSIVQGGGATPPAYLGVLDLARNMNEMAAHMGMPLVAQVSGEEAAHNTLTVSNVTPETFAIYRVQTPAIRAKASPAGSTSLRVRVTIGATAVGATTFAIRATSPTETGDWSSWSASGTSVEETLVCYVDAVSGISVPQLSPGDSSPHGSPVDPSTFNGGDDTYQKISIEVKTSYVGNTTITIKDVHIFPSFHDDDTTYAYATDAAAFETDVIFPQDDEAWDTNSPLNVQSVKELIVAHNQMYIHSHRHVANMCIWTDHATTNPNLGLFNIRYGQRIPLMQFIYWPRSGVKNLAVSVNARVAGGTGYVGVKFDEGAGEVSASETGTSYDWTTWTIDNAMLAVPPGLGPRFITLWGEAPAASNALWVGAVSIIEIVERTENAVTYEVLLP